MAILMHICSMEMRSNTLCTVTVMVVFELNTMGWKLKSTLGQIKSMERIRMN